MGEKPPRGRGVTGLGPVLLASLVLVDVAIVVPFSIFVKSEARFAAFGIAMFADVVLIRLFAKWR